jgi:hypothetical protein
MIERTQSTGRTRPYPLPDVLRAITSMLKRPGGPLPEPHRIDWPHRIRGLDGVDPASWPAAMLGLETGRLAGVAAWAAVLEVRRISVFADARQATITVIGRTSTGPVVAVYDTVSDWPLEPAAGEQFITADELAAIAADVTSAENLAGAR